MKFGVCALSSIPVRSEPTSSSEMTSQLLFGEAFRVIAESSYFIRIEIDHDGHSDWIDRRQSVAIDDEAYSTWKERTRSRVADTTAVATSHLNGRQIDLVRGCALPHWDGGRFRLGDDEYCFDDNTPTVDTRAEALTADALLSHAEAYVGSPYLWGGRSPFGIDCSGLVQVIYQFFDVALVRNSVDQARQGDEVASIGDAKVGDLAFFTAAADGSSHVGLIVPEGVLHASAEVRIDPIDDDGITAKRSGARTHHLTTIRRVAEVNGG